MTAKPDLLDADAALGLLANVPVALTVVDSDGIIIWRNAQFAETLMLGQANPVGKTLHSVQELCLYEDPDQAGRYRVMHEGQVTDRWISRREIDSNSDKLRGYLYLDFSMEHKLATELASLSTVDPVSGLLNQRSMLQSLEPLVSRSRRYQNPLSIIAMEILNLNEIGEQYGSVTADETLISVGHLLKDQMRWADIISRVSPERLIMILPETELEPAMHLARKLSEQVNDLSIPGAEGFIEAAFGVSFWQKGNDAILLLRNANLALADARDKGPGTVLTAK